MGKGSALKLPVAPAVADTLPPSKGDACNAGAVGKDPFFNSHGDFIAPALHPGSTVSSQTARLLRLAVLQLGQHDVVW